MYVTEIKEKQIFKRIQVATPHFWERFLQIADPCLFFWKLPRCEPKCPQQRSDIQPQALRICKKRTQKVLMFATWFFQIFVFLLFLSHTPEVYSNHYTVCMFYYTECLSFKVFCLKRSFRASFRRKLGGSAICSKCEQNSNAALSVAYLFFIIYLKSKVWTITRLENLRW